MTLTSLFGITNVYVESFTFETSISSLIITLSTSFPTCNDEIVNVISSPSLASILSALKVAPTT